MAVQEPSGEFGLWPKVKALSGWPDSNEDVVGALAQDWRAGGEQFSSAAAFDLSGVAGGWQDGAGAAFVTRVAGTLQNAYEVADRMVGLADRVDGFAAEVAGTKTGIRNLIEANIGPYGATELLPAGLREAVQTVFVAVLAGEVNSMMSRAAARIAGEGQAEPGLLDQVADVGGDLLDGAAELGADLLNGAASLGNAALNNPGLVLTAAGGLGLAALSGGGELLGVGLTLTGGGAVAGVPLAAVSAAGVAAGLTTAGVAAAAIAEQAAGADRVEPFQVNSSQNPPGAREGWQSRPADNGKGTVYQQPGSQGNANMFRDANPTPQYPNGYVRFYNEHGQPVDLNGKPGPNSATHIPKNADGTYPLPKGW